MINNLFSLLNGNLMQQLQQNPVQFLMQRRFNLPPNFQGGPQEIVQHLLNTGQMSQQQFDALTQRILQTRM